MSIYTKVTIPPGTGRSSWLVKKVDYKIRHKFGSVISSLREFGVTIRLFRAEITGGQELTVQVVKHYLDKKDRTLDLFEKAMDVIVQIALVNLGRDLHFTLNLGKLIPKYLTDNCFDSLADNFMNSSDYHQMISFLYGIDALVIRGLRRTPAPRMRDFDFAGQHYLPLLKPVPRNLIYPEPF
jgi:hypothetical protein